jgi:hypothetical protein
MIGSGYLLLARIWFGNWVQLVGCYGVLTGTITVIAAVSYGELSAMFP